ncbi:MAG TPA: hypothetical protein VMG09_02570 [Bacteroidota bacterium]|nr:hypothetical protein [Bacteroidota bacterium]
MRKDGILLLLGLLLIGFGSAQAQFKSQLNTEDRVSDGMAPAEQPSMILGFFDPEKFHMHHSFSLSYQTMGGQGMSLGSYTNSMTYDFTDRLNARADLTFMYSPYNSLSSLGTKGKNDLSSLFLSRAEVNYKPWDNVLLQVQFRQVPYGGGYFSPYYDPWFLDGGY